MMNSKEKRILLILSFTSFLIMYTEAMMIPALPQILAELNYSISSSSLAWIITSYLLVAATTMALLAKLSERYGRKVILLLSILIYLISVSLSGFQVFYTNLIILRGIQGIGAGVFPISYSIISDQFDKHNVGLAQGVLSSMFALGASMGIIGGAMIDYLSNWQWSYHTIVPFVILDLVFVLMYIPKDYNDKNIKIDMPGIVTLGITLFFFVYSLTLPFSSAQWYMALSLVIFILFIMIEWISTNPIVRLDILKSREVMIANITAFFIGVTQFEFYQPIILKLTNPGIFGFNLNYLQAGLIILPYSVIMLIISPVVGFNLNKISKRFFLIFGSMLIFAGYALLGVFNNNLILIIVWELFISSGLAIDLVSSINLLTTSVSREIIPSATGMNMIARTAGGVVGGTIAGYILSNYTYYYNFNIYALPIILPDKFSYLFVFSVAAIFAIIILITALFSKK
ncbi:MAG: MFS transporter [Thermoplasmata archaeon]